MTDKVSIYFDPACPFAWLTSRWLIEAAEVRDLEIEWRVMSLYLLNKDKLDEIPEFYADLLPRTRPAVRLAQAAAERHGNEAVGRLYSALGEYIHRQGMEDAGEYIPRALADAGLPEELKDLAYGEEHDEALQKSHDSAMGLVGQDVGTPVIAVEDEEGKEVGFFGPVISDVVRGERAGRMWDGVLALGTMPEFYELKRTRDREPNVAAS
ncbi:mycothiol-dependent nitroreductase Rv2466c family protein [Salininema proteolyticum]|uniref:DsbA family protein n=1 Tax=Salininema proteolyticum TaxID=1607685 RepID=A0ABV8U284_9ACTN